MLRCFVVGDCIPRTDQTWTEEHDWKRLGVGQRLVAGSTQDGQTGQSSKYDTHIRVFNFNCHCEPRKGMRDPTF